MAVSGDRRIEIDDTDFSTVFDGVKWTAEWKWERGEPKLKNRCAEYAIPCELNEEFDGEVEQWIRDGWLLG